MTQPSDNLPKGIAATAGDDRLRAAAQAIKDDAPVLCPGLSYKIPANLVIALCDALASPASPAPAVPFVEIPARFVKTVTEIDEMRAARRKAMLPPAPAPDNSAGDEALHKEALARLDMYIKDLDEMPWGGEQFSYGVVDALKAIRELARLRRGGA